MTQGNQTCPYCHGRGGYVTAFGWRKCACRYVTPTKRKAYQRLHEPLTPKQPPQQRLF